jgi:putative glutamine amidotransferase
VIGVPWPKPDDLEALARAGAVPRILMPSRDPVPDALDRCDGLLLTGGEDVDPMLYGASSRHPTVKVDRARDDYELALTRGALDRKLPILAICRGIQVLNVAAGGTLVQDLPTERPGALAHRAGDAPDSVAHDVLVTPDSELARLLDGTLDGAGRAGVNSRHHQAIDRLAPGLRVAALAPDGVVEAVEKPGGAFCLGVQWHPENFWRTGRFARLFTALVEAAARR